MNPILANIVCAAVSVFGAVAGSPEAVGAGTAGNSLLVVWLWSRSIAQGDALARIEAKLGIERKARRK